MALGLKLLSTNEMASMVGPLIPLIGLKGGKGPLALFWGSLNSVARLMGLARLLDGIARL